MKIVDLFSGAGGLTFGFYYNLINNSFQKDQSSEIVFANEFDKDAAETFKLNFPSVPIIVEDIKKLTRKRIESLIKGFEIDLIIGGPPCQSFSTIGRRIYDDKAKLYSEYLRVLKIIKPKMFVFENVKGILSMKDDDGNLVIDVIRDNFSKISKHLGYEVSMKLLNAADYGVPQLRERVFIVGVRKDLSLKWDFPEAEYNSSNYLTISEAISDLPKLESNQKIEEYKNIATNAYQKLMRGNSTIITNHHSNLHGEKIKTIIKNLKEGQSKDDFNKLVDEKIIDEKFRIKSGYKNTYGRYWSDRPATTITNNLSTPSSLRCIHYSQNRAITSREGARIQSFPDWFKFSGSRVSVNRQIGNAVPPLLALKIAENVRKTLKTGDE